MIESVGAGVIDILLQKISEFSNLLSIPLIIMVGVMVWKQNNKLSYVQISVKESLKNHLKDVHDKALKQMHEKNEVAFCHQDLFYSTYMVFTKDNYKDEQVELWKRDFDKWCSAR